MSANQTEGEAQNAQQQPTMLDSFLGMANSAMQQASELDQQYGISKKVQETAQAGINKATEIDQTYGISEKVVKTAQTVVEEANKIDAKHKISENAIAALNTGAQKAKDLDSQLGVSEKVTSVAKSVDGKLGISKTASKMDEAFALSAAATQATKVMGDATKKMQAVLATKVFTVNVAGQETKLALSANTVKFGEADPIALTEQMTGQQSGANVKLEVGIVFDVTFGSAEEAAVFTERFNTAIAGLSVAKEEVIEEVAVKDQ